VPGWHAAIESLKIGDRLQTVGILQEQHPDRARLFMQWKRMDWPLLVDSLSLLNVAYVPITVAIDENGIVRAVDPPLDDPAALKRDFVDRSFGPGEGKEAGERSAPAAPSAPDLERLKSAAANGGVAALLRYADALVLWEGARRLDEAIAAYRSALELEPQNGVLNFHLGVAYRKRFDSDHRRPDDFRQAVGKWSSALEIDPNNYIWRRRIQQYGPRLDKPYSFYDWVRTARKEIRGRGALPVPLVAEPGGAEFAYPASDFMPEKTGTTDPDPKGRIRRDRRGFVEVETVVVPPAVTPGATARIHVTFTPNHDIKAHWNNEVSDLLFWVDPPKGWGVESRRLSFPNPPKPVSREVRKVEFEIKAPAKLEEGSMEIPAFALYYVCEDVKGTCLYRRQDVSVRVEVAPPKLRG
jgi:tetratricopeptide (TPR) repeat protein